MIRAKYPDKACKGPHYSTIALFIDTYSIGPRRGATAIIFDGRNTVACRSSTVVHSMRLYPSRENNVPRSDKSADKIRIPDVPAASTTRRIFGDRWEVGWVIQ